VGLNDVDGLSAPETILRDMGGNFSKASADWGSHVEVDTSGTGPLITGTTLHLAGIEVLRVGIYRSAEGWPLTRVKAEGKVESNELHSNFDRSSMSGIS
jgi:hypothetical protein